MQKHFPSLQPYGRRRRQVYVLALENTLSVEVYIRNKVYRIQRLFKTVDLPQKLALKCPLLRQWVGLGFQGWVHMEAHAAAALCQAIQGHSGILFLYLLALEKKKDGWNTVGSVHYWAVEESWKSIHDHVCPASWSLSNPES